MNSTRFELVGSISTSPSQCGFRTAVQGAGLRSNVALSSTVIQVEPPLVLRYTSSRGPHRSMVVTTRRPVRWRSVETPPNPPCPGGGLIAVHWPVDVLCFQTAPLVTSLGPTQ